MSYFFCCCDTGSMLAKQAFRPSRCLDGCKAELLLCDISPLQSPLIQNRILIEAVTAYASCSGSTLPQDSCCCSLRFANMRALKSVW